ncbi:MAG: EpsG family protein [Ferruginibacter sp.]
MLVYILFFIFIAILAIDYEFNQTKSNYMLVFVALALALLAGFHHPDVTRDSWAYLYAFETVFESKDPLVLAFYEPGFVFIIYIIRSIFTYNYGFLIMLVFALSSVFFKIISIRALSINPYLVILFYFSHFFMLHEMTQIRIGLASAIFFVSIKYYLKGNIKAYIGLILMAACFHYTAILYLGILFFKKDSFNRYWYSFIILFSVGLSFFQVPLIGYLSSLNSSEYSAKFDNYVIAAEYMDKIKVLNMVTILNILCCLYLIVAVVPGGITDDKKLAFFLKCNILSIFLLAFFSGVPSIAFRLSDLFGMLSMFTFAYLARYLPLKKFNIFVTIIIAVVFFYFFVLSSDLIKPYRIVHFI